MNSEVLGNGVWIRAYRYRKAAQHINKSFSERHLKVNDHGANSGQTRGTGWWIKHIRLVPAGPGRSPLSDGPYKPYCTSRQPTVQRNWIRGWSHHPMEPLNSTVGTISAALDVTDSSHEAARIAALMTSMSDIIYYLVGVSELLPSGQCG